MRLRTVGSEFGQRLALLWRASPLRLEPREPGPLSPHAREEWARVASEMAGDGVKPARWPEDRPGPSGGLLPLLAAVCARRQGPAAFERFHQRLFAALFVECVDIGSVDAIAAAASAAGLDLAAFSEAMADPAALAELRADWEAGAAEGIRSVPTVVLARAGGAARPVQVRGAAPLDQYRRLVGWLLRA